MIQMRRRSDCPISFALDTFGDKWSLLIIRDLMFKGKSYFGDFLSSEEHMATNILANRLRRLEAAGLIHKKTDHAIKTKNVYSLTQKGIDLAPMLVETILWSAKYDSKTATSQKFIAQAKRDKEKLILNISKKLKYEF